MINLGPVTLFAPALDGMERRKDEFQLPEDWWQVWGDIVLISSIGGAESPSWCHSYVQALMMLLSLSVSIKKCTVYMQMPQILVFMCCISHYNLRVYYVFESLVHEQTWAVPRHFLLEYLAAYPFLQVC